MHVFYGKPHRKTWDAYYDRAWSEVDAEGA